ncbi:unnamed protein product [Penicillium salamii]|uniref:Splicing factor YJU2 n=1 Tax=Penicillium salamii TaxID=1612424 RepID=A0A9W4NPL0_9EURO|nr:unnamed protein product [Penicillium salamii]CAG8137229.1 unnamed protein product [Penicillium salamii]CAG8252954.1 unnamed protein product [Penicillium salamii]CAG8304684.1 unnamed protein product [Penicillium salamii]CAG8340654.1 unnamed protein product [Penicillium salamii]
MEYLIRNSDFLFSELRSHHYFSFHRPGYVMGKRAHAAGYSSAIQPGKGAVLHPSVYIQEPAKLYPYNPASPNNMAERKVSSKYYPPDFDPSAIAGRSKKKDAGAGLKTEPVRLMAPFSMKCLNCAEYIYKGRKFNARKETLDEAYIGVKVHRFYIKCTGCKHEITFKTDPKNADYTCERGAQRNSEVWRDPNDPRFKDETEEEALDRIAADLGEEALDEDRDKMAELEDKMKDSKREMEVADALDEIRSRNARIQRNEATEKKVVVPKKNEKVFMDTAYGGKLEFDSQEEMDAFKAEIKQKAYKAFHDTKGNRLKRDGDGNIIRRYTPQEEAQGLHLLDDKPNSKINLPASIPEEDEIIGEEESWSDFGEDLLNPKPKKAKKVHGDRQVKKPRKASISIPFFRPSSLGFFIRPFTLRGHFSLCMGWSLGHLARSLCFWIPIVFPARFSEYSSTLLLNCESNNCG